MPAASLRNKSVLITGASSGFGAAAALTFAREGAHVFLGARRTDRLKEVAQQCLEAGASSAEFQSLDVSSTESVQAFVTWFLSRSPDLHILINNAGGALGLDPVATATDADWEGMFQSNVLGLLRMTRACLPALTQTPGSLILNIGSIAGRVAYEGGAAYCAAKAGELQITKALRLELCGTGVRVCTLDPGLAETEFSIVRFKGDEKRAAKVYEGVTPLSAEDVAEAMLWIANRPPHVNIDEMVIKCTDQAAIHKVNRKTSP